MGYQTARVGYTSADREDVERDYRVRINCDGSTRSTFKVDLSKLDQLLLPENLF